LIKDILNRDKTPIIEGGSPFYITQIFNPYLTNYNDEKFHKAREIARNIIDLDGKDFSRTFARMKDLCKKVGIPESEAERVGLNDFFRLENKIAFALYLQQQGETFEKFNKKAKGLKDNVLFSRMNRQCFYLFGNKFKINQVLDMRTEDMVLNE